jgi:ABC-type branched-subunit amino acid transport system substrate-binding protein
MRRSPLVLVALLLAVALSACGARVDDNLRQQAAAGALGGARGGGTAGGGAVGEDGMPLFGDDGEPLGAEGGEFDLGAGGEGGDPGAAGGDGAAGGGGEAAGGEGGGGGGGGPAGGNGGATDVGVTGNSIVVGTVADLSGPVPGLFQGAVLGTQAYFAKVNSEGGVHGRQIKVQVGDGQLDCGQNKAQHAGLSDKVFAFVGSFSLYDDCGQEALDGKNVPDVHNALGKKAAASPNNFSVQPIPQGWRTGPLLHYKQKWPDRFTKIGSIWANAGGAGDTWVGTQKAIESLGGKVLYERGFGPTDTDFTADIVQMRNRGVQMIYVSASDAPTFARIARAARQQNVDWPIIAGGIAYDEGFIKQAGDAAEGIYNDQQYTQFFTPEDAAQIPAVKEFQTWTSRVGPGKKRDVFSIFGWSSAALFVQALEAAGPEAKRDTVLAELKKINTFDAGGVIAPANPAAKEPPVCYVLNQVKGGKWVRYDTPPNAFRCDGTYFRTR